MKKQILKQGLVGLLAGISIALGSAGCTEGTWYLFGKSIDKNPTTGELIIRDCKTSSDRSTGTRGGNSSPADYSRGPYTGGGSAATIGIPLR